MGGFRDRKALRERLHKENPNCCYCGVLTVIRKQTRGSSQKDTDATIEHKESRLAGRITGRNKMENLTLACYKCNHERGISEEKALTSDERLRRSVKGRALISWFESWMRDMERFDRF